MSSNDLHVVGVGEKKVDVKIAQEYLRINREYHSVGFADSGQSVYDKNFDYTIFLTSYEIYELQIEFCLLNVSKRALSTKFMDLAELVLKNVDLLCQLDYLIRRTPVEHTRDVEIKLLVQNLIYHSTLEDQIEETPYSDEEIFMYDDTPLSVLGLISQTLSKNQVVTIFPRTETAAICSVFVDLCHKVGLEDHVYLVFLSFGEYLLHRCFEQFTTVGGYCYGCAGIVSANANVDSATETFVHATGRVPWYFQRIYVQECVLDQFKERIEWKTMEPSFHIDKTFIRSCSSVRSYENKVFLFDFVGDIAEMTDYAFFNNLIMIRVEAYRTNEELISLMSGIKTVAVSLWSNDFTESNEIAFNIKVNIVWINDFCRFDGPPAASQVFYSLIFGYLDEYHTEQRREIPEIEEILEKRNSWNNLDETDRYLKVWKATRTIRADIEVLDLDAALKCFDDSTTSIGNKICTLFKSPVLLHIKIKSLQELLKHTNFILRGCAVFVLAEDSSERDTIIKYCEELQSYGAPVAFTSIDDADGFENEIRYERKFIWSSKGTIFAN